MVPSMRIMPGTLACFLALTVLRTAHGVDASKLASKVEKFESWQASQFALPRALLYRMAAVSANYPDVTITVDLSDECLPLGVVLNWKAGNALSNGSLVMFAYKIPGGKENQELVAGVSSPHDAFAFFPFQTLTAKQLYATNGRGNLTVWIPASGDGTVKRSSNIYVSLEGFTAAYDRVTKLCMDNR
jgi:hypothetical protein